MPTTDETIERIVSAPTWDDRIARIRQIPARHGTNEHTGILAEVARQLYVPHLAPDYAYVHVSDFYELPHFQECYAKAASCTENFTKVSVDDLATAIQAEPQALLALRVITGLTRGEFAASTGIVAGALGLKALSPGKVDAMERSGTAMTQDQARVAAETLDLVMGGTMFGGPLGDLKSKQQKPDTARGWGSVRQFASDGVPYEVFLHQRHYGGAFRQVLDATSELRGNLIEDAVGALFDQHGILYIRTGSHNQDEIATRFEVTVQPAPDFVVFDTADNLRALIECKGANDGGTARDKAPRFKGLHEESIRLGGIPLVAVLGGLGWTRLNDTLGPVVRYCDGRVFFVSNLDEMMTVAPFASLAR